MKWTLKQRIQLVVTLVFLGAAAFGCEDKPVLPKDEHRVGKYIVKDAEAPITPGLNGVLVETPSFSSAVKQVPKDITEAPVHSGAAEMTPILRHAVSVDTRTRTFLARGLVLEQQHVHPLVTIATTRGKFVIKIMPEMMSITSANFIDLCRTGFYKGTVFHRYEPGFVIQGGDPTGTGTGGPGYTIPDQDGPLLHDRGVVAMAKSSLPDSAGSQFYVVLSKARAEHLNHHYATFGKVIRGMDVVDKLRKGDKILKTSVAGLPKAYLAIREMKSPTEIAADKMKYQQRGAKMPPGFSSAPL